MLPEREAGAPWRAEGERALRQDLRENALAPLALGVAVTIGLAMLYAASILASAGSEGPGWTPRAFLADPLHRIHLVLALLIGYTAAFVRATRRLTIRDVRALRPLLGLTPAELDARLHTIREPDPRRIRLWMAGGAVVGIAIDLFALRTITFHPQLGAGSRALLLAWELLLNALLFALLGRVSYESLRQTHFLSKLGRNLKEVPLFDPRALAPFARAGLRNAAAWFVGSSLASLLFLDAGAPVVIGAVLVVTVALAVVALLRPTWGVHRRLHAAKERELGWVRAALAREGAALEGASGSGGADGARIQALLGYEARVEAVREWPFGTPTVVRFGLFLLLPLGSWLGGALVERLVDLWLH